MTMPQYVNPFGGYATGYHQGVGEEVATQEGARQARDSDWMYRYMDPLKLEAAQRENTYGNAALPFQVSALAPGLQMLQDRAAGGRLNLGNELAVSTGQTGVLDASAHALAPNATSYYTPQQYQRGADFGRNLEIGQMDLRGQQAQAAMERAQAMADWYERRYGGGPSGGARGASQFNPNDQIANPNRPPPTPIAAPAAAPTSGVNMTGWTPEAQQRYQQMQQQHQQVLQAHPAPAAPAPVPAPAGTPAPAAAPHYSHPDQYGNDIGAAQPPQFHALHPVMQGHVINGVSQALGITPEQALAHIQSQPGGTAPQAPGTDASEYYG